MKVPSVILCVCVCVCVCDTERQTETENVCERARPCTNNPRLRQFQGPQFETYGINKKK
jgi:hypothetical protein